MALHDEILREIIAGRIPARFRISDLKTTPASRAGYFVVGCREYSKNAIATIPRNHSVRPDGTNRGDYVRKNRNPAFFWFGNGEFELIPVDERVRDVSVDAKLYAAEGEQQELISVEPHDRRPLNIVVNAGRVRQIAEQEPDPPR